MSRVVWFAGGGTGGHLYPALAIARSLVRLDPSVRPFFVGAERGIERTVLPAAGFPYLLLDLHPLYRTRPWENWRTLRGAMSALRALGRMARVDAPSLIVGTGGYAAGAALAYGAMHGIPIVQQAGDSHPGLTARAFRRWTREYYLAFPEAARVIGGSSSVFVDAGAPIESPPTPLPDRAAARRAWSLPEQGGTVVLVYGGSQGSRAINLTVSDWVTHGLRDGMFLIWATGKGGYEEFRSLERPSVRVREYLSPIADAYAAADLAIARAGAMTTAELFAWRIPAILIPLPTSAADHQTENARTLDAAGAAVWLAQSELTAQRLESTVHNLLDTPAKLEGLRQRAALRARPAAADVIARRILTFLR